MSICPSPGKQRVDVRHRPAIDDLAEDVSDVGLASGRVLFLDPLAGCLSLAALKLALYRLANKGGAKRAKVIWRISV
jgi:hypothetical protein